MLAASIISKFKPMKRHFAFLAPHSKAEMPNKPQRSPSIGPFLSTSNSHHFSFVHEVRRFFNSRSRCPFSYRHHLAFSRKATLPNHCICAFAKSTYALRASFDARSAPDRLSRSINPRQRRRQHADKALWLTRFPICPLDKKRDNQPKKGPIMNECEYEAAARYWTSKENDATRMPDEQMSGPRELSPP